MGRLLLRASVLVLVTVLIPCAALAAASWHSTSVPVPTASSEAQLEGVSCVSTSSCVAVGEADNGTLGDIKSSTALVENWNGTAWSGGGLSDAPGRDPGLTAVSCVSATFCAAVGSTNLLANSVPLAEMWNGTTWTAAAISGSGNVALSSISCASPTFCAAVGTTRSGEERPFVAVWRGTSWRVAAAPKVGHSSGLNGVSCVAGNACTAVGFYDIGRYGSGIYALVERWNGKRWFVQDDKTAAIKNDFDGLDAVSCTARSSCMAVGAKGFAGNGFHWPFGERWNGAAWRIDDSGLPPMPTTGRIPPDNIEGDLNGLSCSGPGSCVAVGQVSAEKDLGMLHGYATVWNGARWATVSTIPISGSQPDLAATSCFIGQLCMAVGSAQQTQSSTPLAVTDY